MIFHFSFLSPQSYFYQNENVLSGLSLSKENVTIRSGYESILRFYGYDLADPEEGNVGMVTTTQFNRREEDVPESTTSMQTTTRAADKNTTVSDISTVRTEPPTTQLSDDKGTEIGATTLSSFEKSTEAQVDTTTETFSETTVGITEPITTIKTTLPTTTIRTTLPTTIITTTLPTTTTAEIPSTIQTTTPTELPTEPETTTISTIQTTYPPTEETTILLTTEMTSVKPTHIFKFKPITTTQLPEPVTKRFYNMQTTLPPLPAIRSTVTDSTNVQNPLTATPVTVPTAIRLNPSDISTNARFINVRNARTFRLKRDASSYNGFIPLAPATSYEVPEDVNFFDPYFSYATPNPPHFYYPEGNPILATKDFDYDDHHHDEIDHIFYLNPHDSIRVGFKVYNTILRYAYIPGIQASVLELPLDSENYSLLIMIPDQPVDDMVNILCSHLSPSLVTIRASLRDNWIRTMIPNFHLRGNVVLTGDLMKVSLSLREER